MTSGSRVAVIPARGGSKRIPRKNVRDFCGKPMIAWSIAAAQRSGCFDRILVSTDDAEIADVSRAAGAEVPFMRPEHLADDHAATLPVIAHAVEWLLRAGGHVEAVCCLYATAPFTLPEDLQRGWELLRDSDAAYAFSVTSYPFPIQRAIRITEAGRALFLQPEHVHTRSQDLEELFHDAGQFYWGRTDAWRTGVPIISDESAPVRLPRHRVQDIDTPEDWIAAELLFRIMGASASAS